MIKYMCLSTGHIICCVLLGLHVLSYTQEVALMWHMISTSWNLFIVMIPIFVRSTVAHSPTIYKQNLNTEFGVGSFPHYLPLVFL